MMDSVCIDAVSAFDYCQFDLFDFILRQDELHTKCIRCKSSSSRPFIPQMHTIF